MEAVKNLREKVILFFHNQNLDEAGQRAIEFEKLLLVLSGFRIYFLLMAFSSIFFYDCYILFSLLLDLYIFIFGSLSLGVGFYGAFKRRERLVRLYIGLSLFWIISTFIFLFVGLRLNSEQTKLFGCVISHANSSSIISLCVGFFDLLMRTFQLILEGLSFYWAVRLILELRSSGPTRSAAYGELGTDDFNVYKNNYEFKSTGTETLFDTDSDLSLGSSDEDDDQPLDLDF